MSEHWENGELRDKAVERLLREAPAPERLDPARRSAIWRELENHLSESGTDQPAPTGPRSRMLFPWRLTRPALSLAAALLVLFFGFAIYFAHHWFATRSPELALGHVEHVAGGCLRITARGRETKLAQGEVLTAGNVLRIGPNGAARLGLDDGSTIWLCTGTELALVGPRSAAAPALRLLRGELRADIAHDPAHPFSIVTPEARLRVLGTRFTCRVMPALFWKEDESMKNLREALHKALVVVTVLSGSVVVDSGAAEQVVQAGQRVVVTSNSAVTEPLKNLDYSRSFMTERQSAPKAEAYLFMPIRESLISALWAIDVQSGTARHLTDFIGWPRMQAQFPSGLGIVNVGGVIFANFGREPISGAGNPIIGDRPVLVDLETGRKIPITALDQYRPLYLDLSPDSRKLAFVGWRKSATGDTSEQPEGGVYVMDLETFKVDLLLNGYMKTCPHWSPDSRWLAISRAEGYVMEHPIVLIDTATHQVVETGLKGAGVIFSPDGKSMVFSSGFKRPGSWSAGVPTWGNLFIADFPRGEARQLTTLKNGGAIRPVFSPDGAALAWWEAGDKKAAQLHVLDMATRTDRVVTEGNAFGQTKWLDGHSRLLLSYEAGKTQMVKLVGLESAQPTVREIKPEWPKGSRTILAAQKAQADHLYEVFRIYAAAIKAQDQHQLAEAQSKFAEGRDLLKTISEASKSTAAGVGPEDLAPYLEKFTAEAALGPAERTERIVSDNLRDYIGTIIQIFYDKYKALPTVNKADNPAIPTFDELALGKADLEFQINHIRSTDAALMRPLFLLPGDDPAKVVTSFKIVKCDQDAGVLVLQTPPLPTGKRVQATYTLRKGNKAGRFDVEVKTID